MAYCSLISGMDPDVGPRERETLFATSIAVRASRKSFSSDANQFSDSDDASLYCRLPRPVEICFLLFYCPLFLFFLFYMTSLLGTFLKLKGITLIVSQRRLHTFLSTIQALRDEMFIAQLSTQLLTDVHCMHLLRIT